MGINWISHKSQPNTQPNFLFDAQDSFAQMQKLQQQMLHQAMPDNEPNSVGAVKQREDDKYVYLDILIRGLDRSSLSVEVVDGQVVLKGQVHTKRGDADGESGNETEVIESFNRSFPAPENTNSKKVEIENSQDLLILKFPKNS